VIEIVRSKIGTRQNPHESWSLEEFPQVVKLSHILSVGTSIFLAYIGRWGKSGIARPVLLMSQTGRFAFGEGWLKLVSIVGCDRAATAQVSNNV